MGEKEGAAVAREETSIILRLLRAQERMRSTMNKMCTVNGQSECVSVCLVVVDLAVGQR